MKEINELLPKCTHIQRKMVADMILSAAEYVRAVTIMETARANVADRDAEEARELKESTDRARSNAHNDLIACVNAVNRICDKHGVPRVYTGGEARREYGDFALSIVSSVFINRH